MTPHEGTAAIAPQRKDIQPHRLGMGWHYVWRYEPAVEHIGHQEDGTPYYWRDDGETSEGCIMYLADQFATQRLGTTARDVYRTAYRQHDGEDFDDEWIAGDALRDAWAEHTVVPERWTPAQVRKLFSDLEDVNYHSFLARLIELVEQRALRLAAALPGWCAAASSKSASTSRPNRPLQPAHPESQPSWHHFISQLIRA